jgi:hypothetical protein
MKPFGREPLVVLYVGYVLIVTLHPFAFSDNFSVHLAQFFDSWPFLVIPVFLKRYAQKQAKARQRCRYRAHARPQRLRAYVTSYKPR